MVKLTSIREPMAFRDAAVASFPADCRAHGHDAVDALLDKVDDTYRHPLEGLNVAGEEVFIPDRLHFPNFDPASLDGLPLAAKCLVTRATDGHLRQAAVKTILNVDAAWVVPFIMLPIGEYVIEIIEDVRAAMPHLNRLAYAAFVRENATVMRLLRARATSYWSCYYRFAFPDRRHYPGIVVVDELDQWGDNPCDVEAAPL